MPSQLNEFNPGGGTASSVAFSGVTAATNTNALVIGTGGSLTVSGSGTINANKINGIVMSLGSPAGGMVPLYSTVNSDFVSGYSVKSLINVVAEYGADNTGVGETHAAIQSALAAVTTSRPGLYFPNGTYLITTALTDPTSGVLQFVIGDGIDKTTLTTNSTNSIFTFTHVTDGVGIDDFIMKDLKIQTTNTPPTTIGAVNGVSLSNANLNSAGTNCVGVSIDGCAFEYFSGYGLSITNPILSNLQNNLFYGNGAGGVYTTGGTTTAFVANYSNFNIGRGYSVNSAQAMSFVSTAADNNGVGYYLNGVNASTFVAVDCEASTAYTQAITTVASATGTATITATNSLSAGNWVVIAGLTSGNVALNGTWQVATASSSQFTFAVAGTIGSNSPAGATFTAYPGWGIQLVGCEAVSIEGYQNYLATTGATKVAVFIDQTTYGTRINGYYQNTAGGTNDIYCAPGSNNVEVTNSFPIGVIYSGTGTNIRTSNIGTLHGGMQVTQSNASATPALAVTINSSGAPSGITVTDAANYANTSPMIAATQVNTSDTGANFSSTHSGTAANHLVCINGSSATVASINQAGLGTFAGGFVSTIAAGSYSTTAGVLQAGYSGAANYAQGDGTNARRIPQTLYTGYSFAATGNVTGLTSLFATPTGSTGSLTLVANAQTVGSVIHIKATGTILVSTATMTINFSTQLNAGVVSALAVASVTTAPTFWDYEGWIYCSAVGAANTATMKSVSRVNMYSADGTTTFNIAPAVTSLATTVATTSTQLIDLKMDFGTSESANTCQMLMATVTLE